MTVAPTFVFPEGHAGDVGLAALAHATRYAFAVGRLELEDPTDEEHVYAFAAWLHGVNWPPEAPEVAHRLGPER